MQDKSGRTDVTDEIKSTLDQLFQFVFWSLEKIFGSNHIFMWNIFNQVKIPVAPRRFMPLS